MISLCVLIITSIPFYRSNAQDEWSPPDPVCPGNLQIVIAEEGELVPFSGQLFTDDAAACIANQISTCVEFARAEMDRREQVYEANLELVSDDFVVQLESRDEVITILEEELADALIEPWYETFAFRFTIGVVSGIIAGYFLHDLVN